MTRRRLGLRGAAQVLGTSVEAVRKRIARGRLESEKADGKIYVWLEDGAPQSNTDALISSKEETIALLREQLEAERQAHAEARRIIAGLVERVPALQAPTDTTQSPEPGEQAGDRGNVATDREQAASVLSGDVGDVEEGVTTSVVTQYVLVGCGIAGSAILYVVGHTDLALLTIGAALLLLSISDFFYTRSLVRWSYATATLGIIAVLIIIAASLLGG
jgi:hypothetical protein